MRQRQAAVPWLSRAPSPAAISAAVICPSSVSSSGATAAYTPGWTRCSPPERNARSIAERLTPAASNCARADDAVLLARDRANCVRIGFGFRARSQRSSRTTPSSGRALCRRYTRL